MRILIYGINFYPELTGIGKYTGEMAEWLSKKGYKTVVITAPPYYPEWSLNKNFKNFYSFSKHENIIIIRCPLYIPSNPSTFKRLLHLLSFSISSFIPVIFSVFWRPSIIIQVAPTLLTSIATILLSMFSKAKSILHIQDFEVDVMFELSMTNKSLFKKTALKIERIIFNTFDYISTISDGMIQKVIEKGIKKEKIIFFPNWSETERFLNQKKNLEYMHTLGIDPSKKTILYSGNMGEKQGLDSIIHVANQYKEKENYQFLMVGNGAVKQDLINLARKLNLSNIIFLPLQPYEDLPRLLACADCHLVIQKKEAADLLLPSKLTNILSVGGNAVITASENTSLGTLCKNNPGIAILVEPESIEEIIKGIEKALKMQIPNNVAQKYSKLFLDKEKILDRFIRNVKALHNSKK
jgi:colanic acid biosynthesis glycosyl transferase WcaI